MQVVIKALSNSHAQSRKHRYELNSRLRRKLFAILLALTYILSVHYAYIAYIHPTFEYANYIYLSFTTAALLSTYCLSWLPIIAYRPTCQPAQAAVALIYALSYIPIQLSLLFTVERDYEQLFGIQFMLTISMIFLFFAASRKNKCRKINPKSLKSLDRFFGLFAIISVALLVGTNIDHMRFVSFADVYELRFEAGAVSQGFAEAYLVSWLSYCFVSYFYARGLIYKKWPYVFAGLIASLFLYMSTGAKSAILLLPITLGLSWLWGAGRDFLSRLLGAMILLIFTLILFFPDDGLGMWAKSIILLRALGSNGWVASRYLEYFTVEGFTYFSHVGPINALTGMYPYGDLSLGQVIGLAYSGSTEANFNASFWASDGFASFGPVGILVVTPVIGFILYVINRTMASLDPKFAVLWMSGFFIALLNVPITTALLSGGGLIILGTAWWLSNKQYKRRTRKPLASIKVTSIELGTI